MSLLDFKVLTFDVVGTLIDFERGMLLYARRGDKDWSMTDCISFEIMKDRGLREALTADHHFEQAGFNILLK